MSSGCSETSAPDEYTSSARTVFRMRLSRSPAHLTFVSQGVGVMFVPGQRQVARCRPLYVVACHGAAASCLTNTNGCQAPSRTCTCHWHAAVPLQVIPVLEPSAFPTALRARIPGVVRFKAHGLAGVETAAWYEIRRKLPGAHWRRWSIGRRERTCSQSQRRKNNIEHLAHNHLSKAETGARRHL